MAITSCTLDIYEAFYSDEIAKGFFHGHTYTANPLACTAALAAVELLSTEDTQNNIQRIIQRHREFNETVKDHPKIKKTRQCGIIYAMDLNIKMDRYGDLRDRLFDHFMKHGVFLRPLGNTIYILPPYITTDAQLQKIYEAVTSSLDFL